LPRPTLLNNNNFFTYTPLYITSQDTFLTDIFTETFTYTFLNLTSHDTFLTDNFTATSNNLFTILFYLIFTSLSESTFTYILTFTSIFNALLLQSTNHTSFFYSSSTTTKSSYEFVIF
jgi:hypothetical protein